MLKLLIIKICGKKEYMQQIVDKLISLKISIISKIHLFEDTVHSINFWSKIFLIANSFPIHFSLLLQFIFTVLVKLYFQFNFTIKNFKIVCTWKPDYVAIRIKIRIVYTKRK